MEWGVIKLAAGSKMNVIPHVFPHGFFLLEYSAVIFLTDGLSAKGQMGFARLDAPSPTAIWGIRRKDPNPFPFLEKRVVLVNVSGRAKCSSKVTLPFMEGTLSIPIKDSQELA